MILHIAGIELNSESGMGRIALEWKKAFERRGVEFLHIGPESGIFKGHAMRHGWQLRNHLIKSRLNPSLVLAHEPMAGWVPYHQAALVSFSHGIEERAWKVLAEFDFKKRSFRSKLIPKRLRFLPNNIGFNKAGLILLSNSRDKEFLENRDNIGHKARIFRNGYYSYALNQLPQSTLFLFNGTWIERKGIKLLASAFNSLFAFCANCRLRIAGAKATEQDILQYFDPQFHHRIEINPAFSKDDEATIYQGVSCFVLPSYFEGQSLALTQAMALGICPIVADNSGQVDLVNHLQNGLLFATGNHNDLLEKLKWVVSNYEQARNLGESAARSVEPFTWQACSDQIVDWCDELLSKRYPSAKVLD